MSEAKLPEELLREILKLILSPSAEEFLEYPRNACPRWKTPHHGRCSWNPPVCDVLLVSKRWLRIGTPLLYESVFIWRPEHTKVLAQLVSTNRHVANAIRRLRIEGGMGKDLYTIAKYATRIHTLYITLNVKASEGIAGLRKAAPLFKPTTLYVHQGGHLKINKLVIEARKLLAASIAETWDSMETLSFFRDLPMDQSLAEAVRRAPALKLLKLSTSSREVPEWIRDGHFAVLASNPSLQEIRFYGFDIPGSDEVHEAIQNAGFPEQISRLIKFVETEKDVFWRNLRSAWDEEERRLTEAADQAADEE